MEILELVLAFTGMLCVGIFLAFYAFYLFFSNDFDVLSEVEMVKPALVKAERIQRHSKPRFAHHNH
jgi:hypothetical protein